MKRIALVLGLLVLVCSTAEARPFWRRNRNSTQTQRVTYTQPVRVAPAATTARPVAPAAAPATAPAASTTPAAQPAQAAAAAQPVAATPVAASTRPAQPATVRTVSYSTATAQGVANIMAARGVVGHFGGNTGYEGCGMGVSPQAAYNICCYANSGMRTVDVGYARGANGMWYCCRRYR